MRLTVYGTDVVAGSGTGHMNKMRIKGILVRLDEPSTKPPNGADGKNIVIPSALAKAKLDTLIGMGLNYSSDMQVHAPRRKVGVITKAWIQGRDLWIEGDVWKHDFPEAVRDLKKPDLGMSMEIGGVDFENPKADVLTLSDFCFNGATILNRSAAAYSKTLAIAASKAKGSNIMPVRKKSTTVSPGLDPKEMIRLTASAAADAVAERMKGAIEAVGNLNARLDALEISILAGSRTEDEDEEDDDAEACSDEMTTGKKVRAKAKKQPPPEDEDEEDDDNEDEDIESANDHGIDEGDLEDMGDMGDDEDDDKPGKLNRDTKNMGSKTTADEKVGRTVASAQYSSLVKANRALASQIGELKASVRKLLRAQASTQRQVSAAADSTDRMSRMVIPSELTGLLAKGGISASEMAASGRKLTVSDVDALLRTVDSSLGNGVLDIAHRMQIKNNLRANGLMEDGVQ